MIKMNDMNTPVNFEIAKLLKEKGFDQPVCRRYNVNGRLSKYTQFPENYNTEIWGNEISAATIAEAVMWLYDTHGIWVSVEMTGSKLFYPRGRRIDKKGKHYVGDFKNNGKRLISNSPTEAYTKAIEYCLNELI